MKDSLHTEVSSEELDAAKVGKMYVRSVKFDYVHATTRYNGNKSIAVPSHWQIRAELSTSPNGYSGDSESMTLKVEHGVGQKLVEVLLPVIIADASRKAQQMADDSKALLNALGDKCIQCITDIASVKPASDTTIQVD